MATVPTVDEVRAWLKLADASMSNDELADVLGAEIEAQGLVCRIPDGWPGVADLYPGSLRMALFRRCGRHIAARGVPLGLTSGEEFGPARLPNFDAEIERLERPLRKFVAG